MNLSVPKVNQSRGRAQRNHSVWALQKRNLNVPPFNDILENCVLSTLWQVWWGIFSVPTWIYEVHKEMIYGVWCGRTRLSYRKPRSEHLWEELETHWCSCIWMEAKSLHPCKVLEILSQKFAVRKDQLSIKWTMCDHLLYLMIFKTCGTQRYFKDCFCQYKNQWAQKRSNSKKDIKVSWN